MGKESDYKMGKSYYLGLDMGTSSIKSMVVTESGEISVFRDRYPSPLPLGWEESVGTCIRKAVGVMGGSPKAISICAQVGSYLLESDGSDSPAILQWGAGGGKESLHKILSEVQDSFFREHISMSHPPLESYPLIRFDQMKRQNRELWERCTAIMAPKDYLYRSLTGLYVSDPYTWRGLANLEHCRFLPDLMERFKLNRDWFPQLARPWEAPGKISREASQKLDIPEGIPVFLGCNDFFAGVLGMGCCEGGSAFDITGTSEHVGMILRQDMPGALISGPYFKGYAVYGVTASSGISMDWAFEQFHDRVQPDFGRILDDPRSAPVFLPYLNGERAPVWNSKARGNFFGLERRHTKQDLFYSVIEGVAFSIKHIWDMLGSGTEAVEQIRVSGGASSDLFLNRMKASLLKRPVVPARQKECGALGAVILAMYGSGIYHSLAEGQEDLCEVGSPVLPEKELASVLLSRYEVYREVSKSLENAFEQWMQM